MPVIAMVIGIDFDNTIANYDGLMHRIALERGLIDAGVAKNKTQIRDTIRLVPDGETEWQKLQGTVYGPVMNEAQLAEGFSEFVMMCARRNNTVHIVSHKTEFANFDDTHSNLRANALSWMEYRGFFKRDGLGLTEKDVFFEATRHAKVERIKKLGCTHFIDDLEATFTEHAFPSGVEKILYSPHPSNEPPPGVKVIASWQAISEYLFDAKC